MIRINSTHDSALTSWVESANSGRTDFPIQNLPHGVFRRKGQGEHFRGGVAIGDQILDMSAALACGVLDGPPRTAAERASASALNGLMALGSTHWSALRLRLSQLLRAGAAEAAQLRGCLVPQADAEYALPAQIGDYTDFFTSYHHMVNAGRIFQPDAPPLPHFKWVPLAYHGRASTVEVSGATFRRPRGQFCMPGAAQPTFGPTQRLDYEMELGLWVGPGNPRGEPIAIEQAGEHAFGVSLLNDWSARDVQAWEAMPLGPFLAKNFLTTVSPWVVTLEALAPFRCELHRATGDPETLAHLRPADARQALDLQLEVWIQTRDSDSEARLSRTSFRHCHWSLEQMITHHTEGGCGLRPGDLIGTGTQSGPLDGEQGCLLELSHNGTRPVTLPNGEHRGYLEDGDTVTLRAWGEAPGRVRVGFGECRGTVLPAQN